MNVTAVVMLCVCVYLGGVDGGWATAGHRYVRVGRSTTGSVPSGMTVTVRSVLECGELCTRAGYNCLHFLCRPQDTRVTCLMTSLSNVASPAGFSVYTKYPVCPEGWERWEVKCFRMVRDIVGNSNTVARALCNNMGGDLVVVTSQAMNDAIIALFPTDTYYCFPGVERDPGDNGWKQLDGSTPTWTNWKPGEPSGDGDCINVSPFSGGGKWNDVPCTSTCGDVILCARDL